MAEKHVLLPGCVSDKWSFGLPLLAVRGVCLSSSSISVDGMKQLLFFILLCPLNNRVSQASTLSMSSQSHEHPLYHKISRLFGMLQVLRPAPELRLAHDTGVPLLLGDLLRAFVQVRARLPFAAGHERRAVAEHFVLERRMLAGRDRAGEGVRCRRTMSSKLRPLLSGWKHQKKRALSKLQTMKTM